MRLYRGRFIDDNLIRRSSNRSGLGSNSFTRRLREPDEVAFVSLPGAIYIPMGEIPGRLHELDPDKTIVVYCHHGVRSMRVVNFLLQRDFENVANLEGGIDAWAIEIEPEMLRY